MLNLGLFPPPYKSVLGLVLNVVCSLHIKCTGTGADLDLFLLHIKCTGTGADLDLFLLHIKCTRTGADLDLFPPPYKVY